MYITRYVKMYARHGNSKGISSRQKQAKRAEIEKSGCLVASPRHKQKPYHSLRIYSRKRDARSIGKKIENVTAAAPLCEINEKVYKAQAAPASRAFKVKEGKRSQRRKKRAREGDKKKRMIPMNMRGRAFSWSRMKNRYTLDERGRGDRDETKRNEPRRHRELITASVL